MSKATLFVALATFLGATQAAKFDYVIVGGGTCGLLLANRLSANPNTTVAIIDPGRSAAGNVNVTKPTNWLSTNNGPIDWHYDSLGYGKAVIPFHAGKALGGSSTINGMTYIRADKAQIDAWEALGNKGWNWDALYPYYKRMENFTMPTPAQQAVGARAVADYHGESGPLKVSFLPELEQGPLASMAPETWDVLGYGNNPDLNSGSTEGFSTFPMMVDYDADLRQDAAIVFYWPVADRPNLALLNGTAIRVLWRNQTETKVCAGHDAVVTGVEYRAADGSIQTVSARQEVILSAGALRTPLVLEASGIGNPKVLSSLGIDTKINLPGVGENMQDQPSINLIYPPNINMSGYAPYTTYATANDLFGDLAATVAAATQANISTWAEQMSARAGLSKDALETRYYLQHEVMFKNNTTIAEMLTTNLGGGLVSVAWPLLPFGMGSVHLQSTALEFIDRPLIDPGYFRAEIDYQIMLAASKTIQEFWLTEPASKLVANGTSPGPSTDAEWESYIKTTVLSNSHPIGTAAMMQLELGGVVDPNLKVYGTSNLRVVDASVLPLQISGHLTATLYAITERIADMMQK